MKGRYTGTTGPRSDRLPMQLGSLIVCLLFTLLPLAPLAASALAAPAATGPGALASQPTQQGGPSDASELAGFMNATIPAQLEANHIAGAAVSVVKDGKLLFAKGYGYSDVEAHTPVSAADTLFRVGSVSKTFLWTAVMQLVEQGKLDLHADVNTYLKAFKIPATFSKPVTMENLMTHTAGFEDRGGFYTSKLEELQPLEKYLAANMPARIRPPGELTAYSNHGAALAGYIVEQISGMPFDRYVEEHIFKPLGMAHSTFSQPVPNALAANLSGGYTYAGSAYQREPFEYIQVAPAGSMGATATDVANFMIAHLQDGQFAGARILMQATAQDMHRQHFTNDPKVAGLTYGFFEMNSNGRHILFHTGDTTLFHSVLALLPDQGVGLFASYNSTTAAAVPSKLLSAFLDHYYPTPAPPAPAPLAGTQERIGQVTGDYLQTRARVTTWTKLLSLVDPVTVSDAGNGRLRIKGTISFDAATAGAPGEWVEVQPYVFRQVGGYDTVVFRPGSGGAASAMFSDRMPIMAYTRLSWYDAPPFQNGVLVACMLIFLVAVSWPVRWLTKSVTARLHGGRKDQAGQPARTPQPRLVMAARTLAVVVASLNVYFMFGFVTTFFSYEQTPWNFPSIILVLLVMPILAAVLALGLVGFTVILWKNRYWTTFGRVQYTLITLAALVFIWWLNYWNMLGYHL